MTRRPARLAALLVGAAVVAGACSAAPAAGPPPGTSGAVTGTSVLEAVPGTATADPSASYAPTTLDPTAALEAASGSCPAAAGVAASGVGPASAPVASPVQATTTVPSTTTTIPTPTTALADLLADPRVAGDTVSVSVYADGIGEIIAHNPETRLRPASNQKLITAMGALALLGPDERLHTDVVAAGPVVDGVLHGDLVLVAGGDPTLLRVGAPHSIDALAEQVRAAGITAVDGRLIVDADRYDDQIANAGWPNDWLRNIGPLSALVLDRNMYRNDAAFLADPALANGEVLRVGLAFRGVPVSGPTERGDVDEGVRVARLSSPTINDLVVQTLFRSDNLYAELLVKEIGHRATGEPGTTASGLARIRQLLTSLCVPVTSTDVDGSGLSYDNARSAREFQALLRAARVSPWGSLLWNDLPVAGTMGAFIGRLDGPLTTGRVRAKGGSLAVARTLSGYATTLGGRQLTFSVLINGGITTDTEHAIDDFVTRLVQLRL